MEKKLRDITEVKIGFKIKSLKDSKRLSQIIAKENDIAISYNTIRRFFGVVKNVQASNFTLDTLSKFNGFDNYSWYTNNCYVFSSIVNGGSIRIDDQLVGDINSVDAFRVLPFGGARNNF